MRVLAQLGRSPRARRAAALGWILLLATCSSPAEPPTTPGGEPPPGGDPPSSPPTELTLSLQDGPLLLHGSTLLTVTSRAADGTEVSPTPSSLIFSTSNASIALVTGQGVVFGNNRGTATIKVTYGAVSASLRVTVKARLAVVLAQTGVPAPFRVGIGDRLPLAAMFVDVDGVPDDGSPTPVWSSSNPDVVSVDQAGIAVALQPQAAIVTATTPEEGPAGAEVIVDPVQTGLPATVRFANGAPGLGPVTFHSNRGSPVTVAPGESVEQAVGSGYFYVTADRAAGQQDIPLVTALIRPGDYVSVFGVGESSLYLDALWRPSAVVADSAMVQVVQSSGYLVVDLLRAGARADDLPDLCYFDPGLASGYFIRRPGPFDILLQRKYALADSVRLRADAPADRPMTLVLTGSTAETASYLTFPDH